jgi:hypothetical protein
MIAMLKTATKKPVRSQKGNALIEFAFVLPVFLTLVLLMITFSIAEYNRTVLTFATAAGARAGSKYSATGMTDTAIKARATTAFNAACGNSLISFTDPIAVPTPTYKFTSFSGSPRLFTVDVVINYVTLNTLFLQLPQNMRIEVQTTMPIEQ